eukprot:TRINITY_DN5674_c0_g1_i1.p1 TRINITY_DN5674_c0_g1~~TRINITY_DN5674_c0_g1_i1.p1  ORF type:complete len:569 (+),score=115.04 TRINITY_DN5674_c0_g1_i1:197-1708(+)
MCLACFGVFLRHSCEEFLSGVADTVPIRCSLPQCKAVIPIHKLLPLIRTFDLKHLAEDPTAKTLMQIYEQAELQAGLSSAANMTKENVLTCHLCGQYAELFVPASKEYWNDLEVKKRLLIEKYEEVMAQKLRVAKSEVDKRIAELQNKMIGEKVQRSRELLETTLKSFSDSFDSRVTPGDLGPYLEAHDFAPHIEAKIRALDTNTVIVDSEVVIAVMQVKLAEQMCLHPEAAKEIQVVLSSIRGGNGNVEKSTLDEIRELADRRPAELAELERKHQAEMSEKIKELMAVADPKYLTLEDVKQDDVKVESSESTKYFVCKRRECAGAFCIACDEKFTKDQIPNHRCAFVQEKTLYLELLDVLAKASTRVCPSCQFPGMKDLACTHITCSKCNAVWCYHCERNINFFGGSFSAHNEWYLNTDAKDDRCPMYLHYKYGDIPNGNRMNGDPARSLAAFHAELQRKAIAVLKEKSDPAVWRIMMTFRFPKGIFAIDNTVLMPAEQKED